MTGAPAPDPEFEALIRYLNESRGFDFGGYKRTSLHRRITKRMQEVGVETFPAYCELLEAKPDEFEALFDTILINVTGFFRDREAWDALRDKALPRLLEDWSGNRPLRIWSAGCASGEEPYSLAMLLAEAIGHDQCRDMVRIYGTDVDDGALRMARAGRYTQGAMKSVPADYQRKYFDCEDGELVFSRDLRRTVIFGRHNVVSDAPISRVDLLLCRNLLIYLDLRTQKQVLPRLHYALLPQGVLFLGKAETMLARSPLFIPIDARHRIFAKADARHERADLPVGIATRDNSARGAPPPEQPLASLTSTLPSAHLLLDAGDRLSFANETARRWFQLRDRDQGRPFQDLEISFRPIELRRLVQEARESLQRKRRDRLLWRVGTGEEVWMEAEVVPLLTPSGRLQMTAINIYDVTALEQRTRELKEVTENLETMAEELQSSNEELETTNEELQSTNEELETTNDELRSTNDELEETNEKLSLRGGELEAYRTSMERLLAGIRFGVVGIDAENRVTYWNPESRDMWGLRADEVLGRDLYELDTSMPLEELRLRIDAVKRGEEARSLVEFHASDRRGRDIDCRLVVTPLWQSGTGADGVLLLIDDVTDRRRHERAVEAARQYAESVIATIREPLVVLDDKLGILTVNRPFCDSFGVTTEQAVGASLFDVADGACDIPELRDLLLRIIPENAEVRDYYVKHDFPRLGDRTLLLNARRIHLDERPTQRILLAMEDVTDRLPPPQPRRRAKRRAER